MGEKDKQLLLKDLSARLPYGVRARFCDGVREEIDDVWDIDMFSGAINADYIIDDVNNYENKGWNKIGFESYEEACEAGIKYCLENLV